MKKIKIRWAQTKKWAIERPVRCSIIGVVLLPVITLVVLLLRYGGFCRDEWVGLAGGLLAYAGTCFVGILAVWQNQRFKAENDAAQERAQGINNRLLKIEERKNRPVVNFAWTGFMGEYLCVALQNIKEDIILDLKLEKMQIRCGDRLFSIDDDSCKIIKSGQRVIINLKVTKYISGDLGTGILCGAIKCRNGLGVQYSDKIKVQREGSQNLYFKSEIEKVMEPVENLNNLW